MQEKLVTQTFFGNVLINYRICAIYKVINVNRELELNFPEINAQLRRKYCSTPLSLNLHFSLLIHGGIMRQSVPG